MHIDALNTSRPRTHTGFTLMEVLAVLAIAAVLAAIVLASLNIFGRSQTVLGAAKTVDAVINDARSRSLASTNDEVYGVHFETNQVVLFTGESYDPADTSNEAYPLGERVAISDISLTGGASAVWFEKITGKASASGVIQFEHVQVSSESRLIRISATGLSEIE